MSCFKVYGDYLKGSDSKNSALYIDSTSWTWLLVFVDDVSADGSSRMSPEVYRAILSARIIETIASQCEWIMTQNIIFKQPKRQRNKWGLAVSVMWSQLEYDWYGIFKADIDTDMRRFKKSV